jgi:hypothetical protein
MQLYRRTARRNYRKNRDITLKLDYIIEFFFGLGSNPVYAIVWTRRSIVSLPYSPNISIVRATGTSFELQALEGMACGCVAAAYRALPWDVAVVSLEAKGPHCILPGHESGQILRLGDPSVFDEEDNEEE